MSGRWPRRSSDARGAVPPTRPQPLRQPDPDPLYVEDDHRVPRWELHPARPEPRRTSGCLWALLGGVAFWLAVAAAVIVVHG